VKSENKILAVMKVIIGLAEKYQAKLAKFRQTPEIRLKSRVPG